MKNVKKIARAFLALTLTLLLVAGALSVTSFAAPADTAVIAADSARQPYGLEPSPDWATHIFRWIAYIVTFSWLNYDPPLPPGTVIPPEDLNEYEDGDIIRPEKTYYEQYVKDVLASGSYTMRLTASVDGGTINLINYHSGMNDEIMAVASMGILQVKLRLIVKNGDYYIVFPTNEYAKFSSSGTNAISGLGDIGDVGKLIADNIGDIFYNPEESLKYDGLISQAGQYCESYVDENGNRVRFYFNNGLQKIDFIDTDGNLITQNVSLVAGVKKQNLNIFDSVFGAQPFEIPRTAVEIKDEAKLKSLLGGMGFPIDDMF